MKIKISLIVSLLAFSGLLKAQNTPAEASGPKVLSLADSAHYAMGFSIAQDLKSRGIKNLNYALFVQAMQDGFAGKTPILSPEKGQQAIMACFAEAKTKANEPLIAEAKRFLEENKKKKGVSTTLSGLQYEVLTAGKGAKPSASDEVTVHYRGSLINGKPFDSSYDRNEPFSTKLNQVIPGWTEGLQLMPVGSKYRFYIPHQLAYGENGAGADIPPFSVLVFEIELIKIGN